MEPLVCYTNIKNNNLFWYYLKCYDIVIINIIYLKGGRRRDLYLGNLAVSEQK